MNGIEPTKFKSLITTVFNISGGKGLKEIIFGKLKRGVLKTFIAKILPALLGKIGSISKGHGKITENSNQNPNYIIIHLGDLDDINPEVCKSVVIRTLEQIGGQNCIDGIDLAKLQCEESNKFKSFVIESLNGLRTSKNGKIYPKQVKSLNPETFKNLVLQTLGNSACTGASNGINLEVLKSQDANIFKKFIIDALEFGLYQEISQSCDE